MNIWEERLLTCWKSSSFHFHVYFEGAKANEWTSRSRLGSLRDIPRNQGQSIRNRSDGLEASISQWLLKIWLCMKTPKQLQNRLLLYHEWPSTNKTKWLIYLEPPAMPLKFGNAHAISRTRIRREVLPWPQTLNKWGLRTVILIQEWSSARVDVRSNGSLQGSREKEGHFPFSEIRLKRDDWTLIEAALHTIHSLEEILRVKSQIKFCSFSGALDLENYISTSYRIPLSVWSWVRFIHSSSTPLYSQDSFTQLSHLS
jgi:hypothetical protein